MRAAFNAGKAAASASHGAVSSRRELEDLLERQRAAECKVRTAKQTNIHTLSHRDDDG